MKWPKLLALVLSITSFAWYSGCSRQNSNQKQHNGAVKGGPRGAVRPVPVGVSAVESRDVPVILSGLGTITPYNTVTVRSRVDGQLVQVNFQEGQFVHEGELLAVIDPRPYQVALNEAQGALARDEALLRTSEINLERAKELTKEGVMAVQQLNAQQAETGQYKGTIELDKATVENAKVDLSFTQIRAPLSGRVGLRLVDPGNIVHATDQNGMLVITQMRPIAVIFTLPEDQIPEVVRRMRAGILPVQAYDSNDRTLLASGQLETLDNTIDPTTGTVRLKGIFDNRDSILWPNQFVNVHLQIQTLRNATVVPSSAIMHGQQNLTFVYVVNSDNRVQMRNVQLKLTQGYTSVIASGISSGERVVVDGQERLQADMTVEPTAPQNRPVLNTGLSQQALGPHGSPAGPAPDHDLENGRPPLASSGASAPDSRQGAVAAASQATLAHSIGDPRSKTAGNTRHGGKR